MPDTAPRVSDPAAADGAASRARMPLIDLIARGALDEEYVEVARRRPPRPPGARRTGPGALAAIGVLVFAVLVTISFQQTRDNEDVVDAGRATLEERIRVRREVVSNAQDRIVELRAGNAAAEVTLEMLEDTTDSTEARERRLRQRAGFATTSGEGVRIVVGDAPDGLARNRVYDEDLALLTNGLWRAGATAIAVNGYRLTALSGFRFAGSAIRLNDYNVTLSSPYTVDVLGDNATLLADLLDTSTGLTFQARADEFGFTLTMQNEDRLSLSSAPERLLGLRSARPVPDVDAAPAAGEEDP